MCRFCSDSTVKLRGQTTMKRSRHHSSSEDSDNGSKQIFLLRLVKVQIQTRTRSLQLFFDNQIITKIPGQQLHNQSAES